jgi:hypothetical protein
MAVAFPRSAARRPDVAAHAQDKPVVNAMTLTLEAPPSAAASTRTVAVVESANYQEFLARHQDVLVVMDFFTQWCGARRRIPTTFRADVGCAWTLPSA